jgi:hypothetical protein
MLGPRPRDLDYRGAQPSLRRFPPRLGLVALLAVVLVALGMALGRSADPSPQGGQPPERPGQLAGPDGQESPGTRLHAGPTGVEAGVPVGYEQSEAGAVAAATQYVVAFGGELALDDQRRRDALQSVASEAGARRLEEQLGPGFAIVRDYLDQVVAPGDRVVMRTVPAGYRITSFAREQAVVEVWAAGMLVGLGEPIRMVDWTTSTIHLRWERGDWRVEEIDTQDGPHPHAPGIADAAEHARQIATFGEYWYAPADR